MGVVPTGVVIVEAVVVLVAVVVVLVAVVVVVEDVSFVVQDANIRDITIKQVNIIQVIPFFILTSCNFNNRHVCSRAYSSKLAKC